MTAADRVQAVVAHGFTERQAQFLVLVMRHAGVCVPRQYARFAGVARGCAKANAFFDKLVRRGYAAGVPCIHNRARLYRVQHRGLYAILKAIWGPNAVEQPEHLWTLIAQLRKKIEPDPSEPRYLLSEPWVGYRFAADQGTS